MFVLFKTKIFESINNYAHKHQEVVGMCMWLNVRPKKVYVDTDSNNVDTLNMVSNYNSSLC